jgi:hypothetical protein
MKRAILGTLMALLLVTVMLFQTPITASALTERALPGPAILLDCGAQFFANPNGVWSYGWKTAIDGVFNLYTNYKRESQYQLDVWNNGIDDNPAFLYNGTGALSHAWGTTTYQPGKLILHPGSAGQYSVLRWTAPLAGQFTLYVKFTGVSGYNGSQLTTTDVTVLQNGKKLYAGYLNLNSFGNTASFTQAVKVNAGETVDFIVGYGNGNYGYDSTEVDASFYLYSN